MKRFSVAAVLTAASLLGVLAIGSTSASAAVLCKKSSLNNYCGYENFYPKETTVQADLAAGTNFTMSTAGGSWWFSCTSSAIDVTTKNVGGLEEVVDVDTNEFALSGCTKTVSVVDWNWGYFYWRPETGGVVSVFARIDAQSPWSPSTTCRYQVAGEGKVVGGNQIVYSNAETFEGGNGFLCPKKPIFSATYDISTPTPLYVERY